MNFNLDYIAVGVAYADGDKEPCVVLSLGSGGTIRMSETAARKLADDLLRNANYLWPVPGDEGGES